MTGPEDAPADHTRPDEQDVTEALRYFRGNPSALNVLGDSAMAVYYSAAAIVRAAVVAAGPDEVRIAALHLLGEITDLEAADELTVSPSLNARMNNLRAALAGARPAAGPDSDLLAQVDAIRKLRVESWEQDNRDGIAARVERAALSGARPAAEPDPVYEFARWLDNLDAPDAIETRRATTLSGVIQGARRALLAAARPAGDDTTETATVPRELLDSLVDGDDCWLDHHGGCQAHGYLSLEPGELCPQQELKQRLTRTGTPWTEQQT